MRFSGMRVVALIEMIFIDDLMTRYTQILLFLHD